MIIWTCSGVYANQVSKIPGIIYCCFVVLCDCVVLIYHNLCLMCFIDLCSCQCQQCDYVPIKSFYLYLICIILWRNHYGTRRGGRAVVTLLVITAALCLMLHLPNNNKYMNRVI